MGASIQDSASLDAGEILVEEECKLLAVLFSEFMPTKMAQDHPHENRKALERIERNGRVDVNEK